MSLNDKLDAFLAGPDRRAWIKAGGLEVFVRRSRRILGRRTYDFVIDLASASNSDRRRGKGDYGRFVDYVMSLGRPIFAENILNPRLIEFYKKRGFKKHGRDFPPCMYWLPPKGDGA